MDAQGGSASGRESIGEASRITEVETSKLRADVHGQRAAYEGPKFDELVGSIRRLGILVPLVVTAEQDHYVVVAGHRRLAAAQRIGLATVPCLARQGSEARVKEISFAENFFRLDLSPIEQAAAIKDVVDQGVMTVDQIAEGFRRSSDWVRRQVALLGWPADVLQAIHEGRISVSAGSNLALVEDANYRVFLLSHACENGATARTTAAWLQAWRSCQPASIAVEAEPDEAGRPSIPAVPQAPCIVCANIFRTDELSHVPMCSACIRELQGAKARAAGG